MEKRKQSNLFLRNNQSAKQNVTISAQIRIFRYAKHVKAFS